MSRLEELIAQLCPDGVTYKCLSEILTIKNGKDYKEFSVGPFPVYGSGGIIAYIDTFVYDKPSVLLPRKGSIEKLYYVDTPFWTVDTIFYTVINRDIVVEKYVFYALQVQHIEKLNTGGGVPSLTQSVLNKVMIPVPPLPIQEEIVRILDTFTELTAELTAELTKRKEQYQYYKDALFSISDDIEYIPLKDLAINHDAKRRPIAKGKREAGIYPYYGASGIVDYVKDYIFDGNYLLVSEDGANLLARNTPIAFSITGKNWVNNHAHILQFSDINLQKYVEFYINNTDLTKYISAAAQPKLTQENLNNILIPKPPLDRIKHIVSILDRFDTLCNDLTSGLPAEIEARQKQYEYYRDKLLTFKEAV